MTDNSFYYSKNPDVESNPLTWNFSLLGNNLVFTSDNGVFSKHTVDYGSRVLIDYVDYDRIPLAKSLIWEPVMAQLALRLPKRFPSAKSTWLMSMKSLWHWPRRMRLPIRLTTSKFLKVIFMMQSVIHMPQLSPIHQFEPVNKLLNR
jgi:hypothetical protein